VSNMEAQEGADREGAALAALVAWVAELVRAHKERLRSAPWPCRGCGAGIPRRKGQGRPPVWCAACRSSEVFKIHERERARVHRAAYKARSLKNE
jgi:hypothetical protein